MDRLSRVVLWNFRTHVTMNLNEMFRLAIVFVKLILCLAVFLGYAKCESMGMVKTIENDIV